MTDPHVIALQAIREKVLKSRRVATCLGFGPLSAFDRPGIQGRAEYGRFVQITADDAADLPVPGRKYTFGVVKAAQARGDFQVLLDRGRRALRMHIGADIISGLQRLSSLI